jgi:hypothetical protein
MKQSIVIMVVCMLLSCGTIVGCFLGAVVLIDHQIQTNRHNGAVTHGLVCELVQHEHLARKGCQ